MKFHKYHALGNDYLVVNSQDLNSQELNSQGLITELTPENIQKICDRHFGIGSDGILLGTIQPKTNRFSLRIFNPDGSEAEKSGNGLRIFSRYLWDMGLVTNKQFSIETIGGIVKSVVDNSGQMVRVEMEKISFWSNDIPVAGEAREVINQKINLGDKEFNFSAATIGNPHCVIILPEVDSQIAKKYGSQIENHPLFPQRTNVQFMKILDRNNIQIEIWERGAGYTLASGSSSSAAAAVAYKLGLCDTKITVKMPGGLISIRVNEDFNIIMSGAVTQVASGKISQEIFDI
ncbi:diaminopimelate epimerase [Mastigocoleus testarum]|uniref:Diaminopimelate epimerase n=1 Tax=Mastigocoleus testarum BC008 TaxID=371196 RepID=A0A0V7ZUV1_9CYAN|nr:diaminopimelate epimerase [Mastigocoleus testarum]KST68145.1 diaminopimelate epimerase [Mastigocoleus testarum BC008]KST68808.1 diaminopimelate epimerase [Mastigocoleus testarum BC008]